MKEKIKNFLLKIKKFFTEKHTFNTIELILIAILINFITMSLCYCEIQALDQCFNETHTQHFENLESERNLIDRDIKGANPTQNDYIHNDIGYDNIFFNTDIDYVINFFDNNTSLFYMPFSATEDVLPIYCYLNNQFSDIYHILLFSRLYYNSSYLYFINDVSILNGNIIENNVVSYLNSNYESFDNAIVPFIAISSNGIYPTLELNGATIPIGFYNQQLYSIVSSKPFENSLEGDGLLTLNRDNYMGYIGFNEYLSGDVFGSYCSNLEYNDIVSMYDPMYDYYYDHPAYKVFASGGGDNDIYIVRFGTAPNYSYDMYLYNYYKPSGEEFESLYSSDSSQALNVNSDVWIETNDNYSLQFGVFQNDYFGSQNDFIQPLCWCNEEIEDTSWYINFLDGYNSGYEISGSESYLDGYNNGLNQGYNSGYNKGKEDGFKEGFEYTGDNHTNAFNPVLNFISKGASIVGNVLSFEVFPNLNLGTMLLFPLVISLIWFIVKLFMGG